MRRVGKIWEDNPELWPVGIPRIKEKQDKVKKEDTCIPGPEPQDKERSNKDEEEKFTSTVWRLFVCVFVS